MKQLRLIAWLLFLGCAGFNTSSSYAFLTNLRSYFGSVPGTRVGIVTIYGTISSAGLLSYQIKEFLEDDTIKAIVLQINSGGGFAGASQAVFNEIVERNKIYQKPIIAWIENGCASGAYYIAAASTHIVATPSACIGSIGAYVAWNEAKDFLEQFKFRSYVIAAGAHKAVGHPLANSNEQQRLHIADFVKDTEAQFIEDVYTQRPSLPQDKTVWAEGKIFTGRQALELGLIDEIGSQITVERAVRRLANITGSIDWVRPSDNQVWRSLFGEKSKDNYPYLKAAIAELCLQTGLTQQHPAAHY